MRFSVDHCFVIGHSHSSVGGTCQDYAASYATDRAAIAVVSDGCSTGGETDIGARILGRSAIWAHRMVLENQGVWERPILSLGTLRQVQEVSMDDVRLRLRLDPMDMLATCVTASITDNGGFIHVQGDGLVATQTTSGLLRIHKFDWAENAPYYPSYGPNFRDEYLRVIHGGDRFKAKLLWTKSYDDEVVDLSFNESWAGFSFYLNPLELQELSMIAVFTDGVTQVSSENSGFGGVWKWETVVHDLLDFKSNNGHFAKRRMLRWLRGLESKGPIDDISYAVIQIHHDEDTA